MQVLMITYTQIIHFHTQQIFKIRPVRIKLLNNFFDKFNIIV